jgi:hypothetical protein
MSSSTIAGLLADDDRRRVFAVLVLGASSYQEIACASGLEARAVAVALDRMENAGLVVRNTDAVELLVDRIVSEARQPKPLNTGITADLDGEQAAVVRTFFRDGRLTSIPMQRKKRLAIFDVLAQRFEPGQLYSESRVNLELGKAHPDVAALRRGMVDEGFMERRDGFYWRAGGTFLLTDSDSTDSALADEITSAASSEES